MTSPAASPSTGTPAPPAQPAKYGTVLYLSADSKMVYAYIGVLKALEEFGLEVDLILAESKAVMVGAAWALGYRAQDMEAMLLRTPLESLLRPDYARIPASLGPYPPEGPDPLQWEIPLGVQSLQFQDSRWSDLIGKETGEYLRLSWTVARMTHDAPGGPVGELSRTPRRLAVQAADLTTEQGVVLTEGDLQDILKGSLLPADVVRARPRLWPFASGSLLTGHAPMPEKLPFSCDRLILVQPGRSLRPPALESGTPWQDSVHARALRRSGKRPGAGSLPPLVIELTPPSGFDPADPDPGRWLELGYTSTLRSMDLMKSALRAKPDSGRSVRNGGEPRLGLDRLSVNPLASGGRELLLDIVRETGSGDRDGSGDAAMASLVRSGYYSDLDIEWTRSQGGQAALVFDAREKSRVEFRSGWNAVFAGEDITDRAPELYGNLSWSEPFYVPFKLEAGALLGGHQPGFEARAMIAPVHPLHLELGFSRTHWEIRYPEPPQTAWDIGAREIPKLRRDLSQVFLKIFPFRNAYLNTSIQKHEMNFVAAPEDAGVSGFVSTDFQETAYIGLGKTDVSGNHPHSLRLRLRNQNRVNTFGTVKYSNSSVESRLRLSWGDFHFTDQFHWSDQSNQDMAIYDLIESGRIDVFTFQDEYFFELLRSMRFQDAKIEYSPGFGNAGLRFIAGAYAFYKPVIFLEQDAKPLRFHWEVQGGYKTPLGILRAGAGGIDGEAPLFYLRLGAGLRLGFDGVD